MPRPHIEFVQTQNVNWEPGEAGTSQKVLNADPGSTEATLLIRYPEGHDAPALAAPMPAEEYFVLDGEIDIGGRRCGRHAYGFIPGGADTPARASRGGATVLVFRYAEDDPDSLAGTADPVAVDTQAMPWDVSTYDPKLNHLRLARKVLRLGPNNSCRTFLLAGMPHGVPPETELPAETHDHCEEMFMISGSMWAPEGLMQPGAYFFRPPHIVHGPHVSEFGFFQIMRSPMTNAIVTNWSDEMRPLPIGAAYAPVMPDGTPESWARPWPGEQGF